MTWFDLLKARLLRRVEPGWEEVYEPEYTRVREALRAKERDGHVWLRIVRHGPDQYSAYYERLSNPDKPLSTEPEWWERSAEHRSREV